MTVELDVEGGDTAMKQALLPFSPTLPDKANMSHPYSFRAHNLESWNSRVLYIFSGFILGIAAIFLGQLVICERNLLASPATTTECTVPLTPRSSGENIFGLPYAGSTSAHQYPPAHPTNAYPSLFPSDVGYPGGTKPGGEPGIVATAPSYPMQTGQCSHELLSPAKLESSVPENKKKKFNIFQSWGNLSPWYSIPQGHFGVKSTAGVPDTCRVTGLHVLHRHGARYPTAKSKYGGPAKFGGKLHADPESWNATNDLEFLNDWTYKLGEELLTPFGRQQLYDLGIAMRMKYGFLLENFTEVNTIPVFRTESQNRMVDSALNFALGFFGYPLDGKYQQSITIEAPNFNNTLAPYETCPNNAGENAEISTKYLRKWANIYLRHAQKRLQKQLHGLDLSIEDVYTMQQLCPYETVALGYSKFCELFTEEEWEGFDYSLDIVFWYFSAYGSPVARAQGIGYVQELVARLTHTPIAVHNSSTNSTLDDNPITFPLDQSLYVDATHEIVFMNIITAMNLTSFAKSGPPPYTHIPKHRSFRTSEVAPFATNMQLQLLECTSLPETQVRVIINDGVVPLTGLNGCPDQKDGMCPLSTFIEAQKQTIRETDWYYDCHGNWTIPDDWKTTTGSPPGSRKFV